MVLKNYITNNHPDFNTSIKTEEDFKVKLLLPFLKSIGYSDLDLRFENSIPVQIGTKRTIVRSDVEIFTNGSVQMVIDVKKPSKSLNERDIIQAISYAKLIDTPPALYAVTTNGIDCIVTNVFTGQRYLEIPSKSCLQRDIDRVKKRIYTEVEIREIKSVLFTLAEQDELYKVINKCKEIIEKKGLIRTDQSFREMTKILLVKMNEERKVKMNEGSNRFLEKYLKASSKANEISEIEVFKKLFEDAKNLYPNIYTHKDETLNIYDNECIIEVVSNLEPFSFLGTGEDIKGAVYEIFLKATLRGDFDQYFTPREIVDFIVRFSDPQIGDIILDPACGSGGFLIQAFNYVNQKIVDSPLSELESKKKFNNLVDKCLWGNEADYDLHVLAKINLIMHGDGWNNIYKGDTLATDKLPNNKFDLILTNPPFTIKYEFPETLSRYELGLGKDSEELDILFVEKCIHYLNPGGDLYIILPEGLLNNKKYFYFRKWILSKAFLILSISLPEGAFIPFGGSVSKTCILGLRKKSPQNPSLNKPKHVFLGRAIEVGYECGKKKYYVIDNNDLPFFSNASKIIFKGIKISDNGGECGWVFQDEISTKRIDASYLLNLIDRKALHKKFNNLVPLSEVCSIENESVSPNPDEEYYYLEVPDISPNTGIISNIRKVRGIQVSNSLHLFYPGDILFTRINPRLNRVTIVPPIDGIGLVSKEVYKIVLKKSNSYILGENKYFICSLLQSEHVKNQIVRLSTGSSSSRARVQPEDLLEDVYVPIPDVDTQKQISESTYKKMLEFWDVSQKLLKLYIENQYMLGSSYEINNIRKV